MCGMEGYIGGREAAPFLVEGLRRLAYRGHDGAGAAFPVGNRVAAHQAIGRAPARAPARGVDQPRHLAKSVRVG